MLYYGAYASSSNKKIKRCKNILGGLSGAEISAGSDKGDMLLFCRQWGDQLRHTHSV